MVSLSQVHSANAALVRSQPLVAVFTAGASGIGSYTAEALAAAHSSNGKGLRAYIVGRKAAAAENVIAECTRVCPSGKFTFVPVKDIALLRDVKVTCNEIVRLETEASAEAGEKPRIDILCMTQGKILLGDRRGKRPSRARTHPVIADPI
jgi:NAD(P)-dependent dehydrogenase (short-subunit alcohol dehydrogenase family)